MSHIFRQSILVLLICLFSDFCLALPFNITPLAGTSFPTQIYPGESITVYYTVRNNTLSVRNNNFVKYLPPNVTQITNDNTLCGATFSLQPANTAGDSCALGLTVTGAVNANDPNPHHHLFVCFPGGITCAGTPSPLSLQALSSIGVRIAGGFFTNGSLTYPLVTVGFGTTYWRYPSDVYNNLPTALAHYIQGKGVSCTGIGLETLCIFNGAATTGSGNVPLLGVSRNAGLNWRYPQEIYDTTSAILPPDFVTGDLNGGASCTGGLSGICIANGTYTNNVKEFPLLALTTDGGMSWTYPAEIYDKTLGELPADFLSGELNGRSSCTGNSSSLCTAAGRYNNGLTNLPLLARSSDNGSTWTFPSDIYSPAKLPPTLASGSLDGMSCTNNTELCVTSGSFSNGAISLPLLAVSANAGITWTYPSDIYTLANLPSPITVGVLSGSNCSGNLASNICIASGFYSNGMGQNFPLLAVSTNAGTTWNYPSDIYNPANGQLPSPFGSGSFNGSPYCMGSGATSICIAAGSYQPSLFSPIEFPLIGVSNDGGASWHYPAEVYTPSLGALPSNFISGRLLGGVTCTGSGNDKICIASGFYEITGGMQLPLLALSTNNGASWSYPSEVYNAINLPSNYVNGGISQGVGGTS